MKRLLLTAAAVLAINVAPASALDLNDPEVKVLIEQLETIQPKILDLQAEIEALLAENASAPRSADRPVMTLSRSTYGGVRLSGAVAKRAEHTRVYGEAPKAAPAPTLEAVFSAAGPLARAEASESRWAFETLIEAGHGVDLFDAPIVSLEGLFRPRAEGEHIFRVSIQNLPDRAMLEPALRAAKIGFDRALRASGVQAGFSIKTGDLLRDGWTFRALNASEIVKAGTLHLNLPVTMTGAQDITISGLFGLTPQTPSNAAAAFSNVEIEFSVKEPGSSAFLPVITGQTPCKALLCGAGDIR